MAQRLPSQLNPGVQLSASMVTLITAPDNAYTTISAATLTNSTATGRNVTLHIVPKSGAPSAVNMVVSARVIAPGESWNAMALVGQTLPAGATVQGVCDGAAAVSFVASGYVTSP